MSLRAGCSETEPPDGEFQVKSELSIVEQIAVHDGALSAPKLSKLLGLNRSTLYRMADEGRIPTIRIGPRNAAQPLRARLLSP